MTNVVRFLSRSELERERLIRDARAIYDSIFPPAGVCSQPTNEGSELTGLREPAENHQE